MQKVKIDLENCYGINTFSHEFDFTDRSTNVIYAPNGSMKTSFANTLDDYSENRDSKDLIYSERVTSRNITADNDAIPPESIFVIQSYNESYESKKISTLLVNKDLKQKYEQLHQDIDKKKDAFVKKLNQVSGLRKNDIENIIAESISPNNKNFFIAISRIKTEVNEFQSSDYKDIKYKDIFSEKILEELSKQNLIDNIESYISTYSSLIDNSYFFKKDTFNHNNANQIASNLKSNGFFDAEHSVNIKSGDGKNEIKNYDDLKSAIEQEKKQILSDEKLEQDFNNIDNLLNKNADFRNFREFIDNNRHIIPYLANLPHLKENLLIHYCREALKQYNDLLDIYDKNKQEIETITDTASNEKTRWINVLNIFNHRFSVPFEVRVKNQSDSVLEVDTPNVEFYFKDRIDTSEQRIEKKELFNVLSGGEKRALYLLNIIFEIEARKSEQQQTLFIIDDIADSFDYKNKYAIIEYLKDISENTLFKQIILTHNFDFYRTVSKRLDMDRSNKFHVIKSEEQISLQQEKYQNNPFNHWKTNFHRNDFHFLAMIPFVRNLAEYSGNDEVFSGLTALLHIKQDTYNLTKQNIMELFLKVIESSHAVQDHSHNVFNLLFEKVNEIIIKLENTIQLEDKIILSIAIRLKTEKFLISVINDQDFVNSITKNQTYELIKKYKELYSNNTANIEILERVNLMTPENIHLNSFMYEPLLDIANNHLLKLYEDVTNRLTHNQ